MIDIASQGMSLLGGLIGATRAAIEIRDDVARKLAVAEILDKLIDAKNAMSTLADEHAALQRRVQQLMDENAELQRTIDDRAEYHLHKTEAGAFVYRHNGSEERGIPMHDCCANCWGDGKQSLLNLSKDRNYYACPRCGKTTHIRFVASKPPRGRQPGFGTEDWMAR